MHFLFYCVNFDNPSYPIKQYVIGIHVPWVVRLYVEIIYELKRVDCLTYRWTNMVLLFYTTYISVGLAHREIFSAKVGKGGINSDVEDLGQI